jgi:hypothetical protein
VYQTNDELATAKHLDKVERVVRADADRSWMRTPHPDLPGLTVVMTVLAAATRVGRGHCQVTVAWIR